MEFFNSYGYGRLSKEDVDKAESDSIKNQRDLIHSFVEQHPELRLVMEGYDDEYTGTDFQRPHFKEMLEAVRAGKINCVIVKDLSRFGREYIESGQYIEKLFPALGVRFIAINDGYDTLHLDSSSSLILPFKNLIKDTSHSKMQSTRSPIIRQNFIQPHIAFTQPDQQNGKTL